MKEEEVKLKITPRDVISVKTADSKKRSAAGRKQILVQLPCAVSVEEARRSCTKIINTEFERKCDSLCVAYGMTLQRVRFISCHLALILLDGST